MGSLFKPDNMCFGASGAGNNWYAQYTYIFAMTSLPKNFHFPFHV